MSCSFYVPNLISGHKAASGVVSPAPISWFRRFGLLCASHGLICECSSPSVVFVLVLVSGSDESVCVQFPRDIFRYIEPDDVALRIDTACLCRDHVFPWEVDGSEVALSEQEPMSLIRRVGEKSNDLAGGINVTSIGHHGVWWIDHFSDPVVHLVGMEGSHVRKDYADDQPAVPRYSIVHAPKHGELLVVSVLQHKAVHRRRGIETQIVETTYDFAPGTDLYGQRVVGPGELDGGKRAVRIPEKAPRKDPRRVDRFRNRNRVEAHDLTFLVDSLRLGAADAIWSINGRVGTVIQQIAMANTSHGVTANDIALRIDTEDGGKGNTGQCDIH